MPRVNPEQSPINPQSRSVSLDNSVSRRNKIVFFSGIGILGLTMVGLIGASIVGSNYVTESRKAAAAETIKQGGGFDLVQLREKSYLIRLHDYSETSNLSYDLMLKNALNDVADKGCEINSATNLDRGFLRAPILVICK